MSDVRPNHSQNDIRPKARYEAGEIVIINRALLELEKHEENMQFYYTGFGTEDDVSRTKEIQEKILECIKALEDLIIYDL